MEFLRDTKIDFMKYRKVFVVVSAILAIVAIMAVFVHGKLNIGVDFAGGTQLTLKFQGEPQVDEIRTVLQQAGFDEAQIQRFGEEEANEVLIRTPLDEEDEAAAGEAAGTAEPAQVERAPGDDEEESGQRRMLAALDQRYNAEATGMDLNRSGATAVTNLLMAADPTGLVDPAPEADNREAEAHYEAIADAILEVREDLGIFTSWDQVAGAEGVTADVVSTLRERTSLGRYALLGAESVGPQIGQELRTKGILAVVLSMVGMLAYIWIRFELRFGVGAVVATLHDVLIVLGFYALMDFEFNLTTVAAFLTLVGYSVNDTVVIFDRVRENLRLTRREPLVDVINRSINQTLTRTILTSGTTLLATASLLVLGGDVLRGFAFVLTLGIVVGTYSSVYVASPVTVLWEELTQGRRAARPASSGDTSKAA
jgi:preprotein translocase subunit SecF